MADTRSLDALDEPDGIDLIQRTSLFGRLGFDETHRLGRIVYLRRATRGTLVVEQDSLGEALYILRSGTATVLRRDSRGERDELGHLGPGEFFGEMSLVDELLASADVEISSDDAEFLVLPRDEFERLLQSDDRLALKVYRAFCRALTERLRRLDVAYVELHADRPATEN